MEENEMGHLCSTHVNVRNTSEILLQKSQWNMPHGIFRSRWKNNVKMEFHFLSWI
jgi:hypothetical protein